MTRIFTWIIAAILFLLLLVFSLNNLEPVTIKLARTMAWDIPLIIVILITFAIGCFIGMLAMVSYAWKRRRKNNSSKDLVTTNK